VLTHGAQADARTEAPGARNLVAFRPGLDSVPVPLVATAEYAEMDPAVSRDGRWLAYVSNETGRNEVYVRPFPDVGAAKVQISTSGGASPLWSRDGKELFFVNAARNMVAVRFESGSRFRVTGRTELFRIPPGSPPLGVSVIDIAPDNRFLMARNLTAAVVSGPASVVLVQNFSEELKRLVPR
jgi:serine/threonine-protein kinase